jgi:hypothetical protein
MINKGHVTFGTDTDNILHNIKLFLDIGVKLK